MRLNLLLCLIPIAAVSLTPLACSSSTTSDDSAANQDDGGDSTDDGGGTTDSGTVVKKDSGSGPFTPGAFPSTYPQVPNNGGGVMNNFRLVTILPSNETTIGLNHFGDTFVASATLAAVGSEYGLGTPTAMTIAGPAMTAGHQYTTADIQSYIGTAISGQGVNPNGNTIYMVFVPAVAWLDYQGKSEQGCHENGNPMAGGVGGYHVSDPYNGGGSGDAWGVVQHCTGDPTHTDAQIVEISASHEVIEAATDSDGVSGYAMQSPQQPSDWPTTSIWDDLLLGEVGDLCVPTEYTEGSYTFQRFWSNKAAATKADPCIPAIPTFFNTATVGGDANGWIKGTGSTMTIPLEGFSTAAYAPWVVQSATGSTQAAQGTIAISSIEVKGTGTVQGQPSIGNGEKGTVTITFASTPQAGDWAAFELVSSGTVALPNGETYHLWPFGVYFP
jgi:hypothetical protein